jgi:hypothetical protein
LAVSLCDEDYSDDILCSYIDGTITNIVDYYNDLLQNEDFFVAISFSFLELDEKTGTQELKSLDYQLFLDPAIT